MKELGPDEGINRLQHPDCRACKERERLNIGLLAENVQLKKKLGEGGGDASGPGEISGSPLVAEGGSVQCDGVALAGLSLEEIEHAIWRGVKDEEAAPDHWPEWLIGAALAVDDLLTQQSSGGQGAKLSTHCERQHHVLCEGKAGINRRCSCKCHSAGQEGGVEEEPRYAVKSDGAGSWGVWDAVAQRLVAVGLSAFDAQLQASDRNAPTQPLSDYKSGEGR